MRLCTSHTLLNVPCAELLPSSIAPPPPPFPSHSPQPQPLRMYDVACGTTLVARDGIAIQQPGRGSQGCLACLSHLALPGYRPPPPPHRVHVSHAHISRQQYQASMKPSIRGRQDAAPPRQRECPAAGKRVAASYISHCEYSHRRFQPCADSPSWLSGGHWTRCPALLRTLLHSPLLFPSLIVARSLLRMAQHRGPHHTPPRCCDYTPLDQARPVTQCWTSTAASHVTRRYLWVFLISCCVATANHSVTLDLVARPTFMHYVERRFAQIANNPLDQRSPTCSPPCLLFGGIVPPGLSNDI